MELADRDDISLLQAFEPVVRFTEGEWFFPVSVERYVARAVLCTGCGDEGRSIEAPSGTLDLDSLAALCAVHQGVGRSLSGVVTDADRTRVRIGRDQRPRRLRAGSRLAVVGMLARTVDALNRASLVFRGSVPGGSASRSYVLQRDHLAPDKPAYYGRVVRDSRWIVCQYWFFYAFNNWRSAFGGVNEHEADWEQVTIFLDGSGDLDEDGLPEPRWVVFSAHDETGDDLRRRWDDPDLTVQDGRHPVVFAGAGSHSGAYAAGDYLITFPAPALGGLIRILRFLGWLIAPWTRRDEGFGLPYVDYARGDGRVIGPGGDPWERVLIDDRTGWVRDYRGLWGHDTRDRLGGERGPAGPRYERDGTVRESWADAVAWAGLAKVAPNVAMERTLIRERAAEIDALLVGLEEEIREGRRQLERRAAGLAPGSPEVRGLAGEEAHLMSLRAESTRLRDEQARLTALADGEPIPAGPHDHLRHRRLPLVPPRGLRNRIRSVWAVFSTPIILLVLAGVVSPESGVSATAVGLTWLVLLLMIEGFLRSQLLAILMRIFAAIALLIGWHYLVLDWQIVLSWTLITAAALLLAINLHDAIRR
jgi:hypothetical protein